MKTKVFLLSCITLIVAVCSAKAQVTKTIDFDYQKAFVFTTIGMDANMNGKPDTGESFAKNEKSTFYINHKDYGSAGSRTDIEIMLVAKGKKVGTKGTMEDCYIKYKKESNGNEDYFCYNKLGELQFFVCKDVPSKQTVVWIANYAMLRLVK